MSTYTTGILALKLGCQQHHIDRLCRRGLINFTNAGRIRLISEIDIPKIVAVLKEHGYTQSGFMAGETHATR